MSKFENLIKKGKIIKENLGINAIKKEIESACYDLEKARESFERKDFKWATIQGYYSIFHSMRALLFNKGYNEKSHYALSVAIRKLYVDNKKLDEKLLNYFLEAMDLRESADYNMIFSEESSKEILEMSEEVLLNVNKVLGF